MKKTIGHLHDDVFSLLRPESFRVLISCANNKMMIINNDLDAVHPPLLLKTSLGLPKSNTKEKRKGFRLHQVKLGTECK